jgi:nucleoside phosphorylase
VHPGAEADTNSLTANRTVWIVGATAWEIHPLSARWGFKTADDEVCKGTLGGRDSVTLVVGMGGERAGASLETAVRRLPTPQWILHTGFAGGVQPGLRSGTLVLDPRGLDAGVQDYAGRIASEQGLEFRIGRIASSPRVLASPAEKADFGRTRGAAAVDMENEAVQAWAREHGIRCLTAKAILDALDQRLPETGPAGRSAPEIARFVAAHWRDLPMLLNLWRLQRRAAKVLSRYVGALIPGLPDGPTEQ